MVEFIHKIIFFDLNEEHINTYEQILSKTKFSKNFSFKHIDFVDLIAKQKINIAISPANSYLSMTGGIDKVYADLFPSIEKNLRKKMILKGYSKSTVKYAGTNYKLPIGRSVLAQTNNNRCHFILASPTMETPKDIKGTKNIYLCMKAIFKKLILIDVPIIVACPCLGTGIGNMSAMESAEQIKKVLDEYSNLIH